MEENNVVKMNAEETKDLDFNDEFYRELLSRVAEAIKDTSNSHLTKEAGGHRLTMVIADFLKENGVEVSETDFDDPDSIVIIEELMDFMVRVYQRISNKALEEIRQILKKPEEI